VGGEEWSRVRVGSRQECSGQRMQEGDRTHWSTARDAACRGESPTSVGMGSGIGDSRCGAVDVVLMWCTHDI